MSASLEDLKRHPMYTESDLQYFLRKGYTHDEIIAFWDRDFAAGHEPLHHRPAPSLDEALERYLGRRSET